MFGPQGVSRSPALVCACGARRFRWNHLSVLCDALQWMLNHAKPRLVDDGEIHWPIYSAMYYPESESLKWKCPFCCTVGEWPETWFWSEVPHGVWRSVIGQSPIWGASSSRQVAIELLQLWWQDQRKSDGLRNDLSWIQSNSIIYMEIYRNTTESISTCMKIYWNVQLH